MTDHKGNVVEYTYDKVGNLITKYKRDSDGEAGLVANTTYTYDALHRITGAKENYGNDNRTYTYDSLGNLTYETSLGNKTVDYKLNNLNQITTSSDDGWKTSTVIKQFVVDYTTATFEPLTEHEVNGLDYRYVYGNDRLSVNITGVETSSGNLIENGNQIRLYYHMDYLGTADYLTSPVTGKVTSWTHYNEWGEITHNAVLKTGQRELDLVKRYATHDYDAVLGMYYAKARMYDAENRRFASVDPVKGRITEPMTMVQYLYVVDDPLRYIDPLGCWTFQYGYQAAAAFGGSAGGSASIAIDGEGNVGVVFQGNLGGGTPNLSVGDVRVFTNAPTIDKLGGESYSIGGSAGFGVGVGLDFSYFNDGEGHDYVAVAFGASVGKLPIEFHALHGDAIVIQLDLVWLYNIAYNEMNKYFDSLTCEEIQDINTELGIDVTEI